MEEVDVQGAGSAGAEGGQQIIKAGCMTDKLKRGSDAFTCHSLLWGKRLAFDVFSVWTNGSIGEW